MSSSQSQTVEPQIAELQVAEPPTVGLAAGYLLRLSATASSADWSGVEQLAAAIHRCAREQRQVFLCGNGGSAANALHLATDLMFGICKNHTGGLRAIALPGNPSLVTCLANDIGYERIFSAQLAVQARPGDLLIAMSGSGNSPNVLHVLEQARAMGVRSFAILGYSGGAAKARADVAIHFAIDDMQISEDLQLIAGHMIMQWMMRNPPVSRTMRVTNDKYLVIGSNSFSGASFVEHLLGQQCDVVGVSRSPEPHCAFLPYRWHGNDARFAFHQLDLNTDHDRIVDLIRGKRPAYVVNFAAQSMVGESWQNPDHWFMTNVVSTVRLHDQLRRLDFLKKYVHVSTPEVYGSTAGFVREDAPFNPSTPYAVSRAAADMSLRSFFAAYDFPVVYTRAANVYGPGQQLYRILPRTILFIKLGRKLQLHGGGTSERSFIHIRDVSDATLRAARDGRPGETYHISTDRIVSIRGLVEMICERLGARFEDCVEIVGERLGKDAAYRLDSGKIRRELGWSDQISLEKGIDETVAWVDRFFDDLRGQRMQYVHKP